MSFKRLNGSPHGHSMTMICCECQQEYELAILTMVRRARFEPCPECVQAKLDAETPGFVESSIG